MEGKAPAITLLVEMSKDAKGGVSKWLDNRIMEIIAVDIPKLALVQELGPTVDRTHDEFQNCQDIFKASMAYAAQMAPDVKASMSATVEHSGERIAEIVDSCISRIMMEDKHMNREAWLDVVTNHAKLCRALIGITEVPEGVNDESGS
jgi:hypothetical protein